MAQDIKYSSSGRMKISAGYKPGSMANYMEFYQAWVTICATMNRSIDNPNRALARRWNIRGRLK